MPRPSSIHPTAYAGHACLQLSTRHGTAILALHGAQLLSWIPAGHRDVFWLSAASRPEPAAIRGGVPICWPWFGKQGMPLGAMQHGPVRNRSWEVSAVHADGVERVSLSLSPSQTTAADDPLNLHASHLQLALHIGLGETLVQTLETRNLGTQSFALTQALHSYFAVCDATQVRLQGLENLYFDDKLWAGTGTVQHGVFTLDTACDRVYREQTGDQTHHYTLDDNAWARRIHIRAQGSQSLVVWNPGLEQARSMVDMHAGGWREFLCVETSNAGQDVVTLLPGAQHRLTQTLSVEHWQPQ